MTQRDHSAQSVQEGKYEANERFTLAEAPGLRVRQLSLGSGQCVPWHYHSEITDTLFCMHGPMCVKTRNPDARHILDPGQSLAIPPGQPHTVSGVDGKPCKFMAVQGVGPYDFVVSDE